MSQYDPTIHEAPAVQPRTAVTKTRPPFPHGKHLWRSAWTLGIWLVLVYPWAYLWHRFGPTKAVSSTRYV